MASAEYGLGSNRVAAKRGLSPCALMRISIRLHDVSDSKPVKSLHKLSIAHQALAHMLPGNRLL